MFPYDQIPVSKIRTSYDIEKFGTQSLLRALNIGRVMAFVGSGASYKFGQPDWNDFKNNAFHYFYAVNAAIGMAKQDEMSKVSLWPNSPLYDFSSTYEAVLGELCKEIIENRKDPKFPAIYFVGLCEKYFFEIGELLKKHPNAGKTLDYWYEGYCTSRPESLMPEESIASTPPVVTFDCHHLQSFRHEFSKRFSMESPGAPSDKWKYREIESVSEIGITLTRYGLLNLNTEEQEVLNISVVAQDMSRSVYRHLGVHRFLTLNYDLEIERMLFEESRSSPEIAYNEFQNFLFNTGRDSDYKGLGANVASKAGRACNLSSAAGKVIRSTSSRPETLADLFAFGAFPTNYDLSVHHLHGRLDDPTNMIVTPEDYQQIYYGRSEQVKSFDEARHAVFTGSDVLVYGMGSGEGDVLKPLRDLLELDSDRIDSHGKVYYLTNTTYTGKSCIRDAFSDAINANRALTQTLYQTYQMHTLFSDFSLSDPKKCIPSAADQDAELYHTEEIVSTDWTVKKSLNFYVRAELAYYSRFLNACLEKVSTDTLRSEDIEEVCVWGDIDDAHFRDMFGVDPTSIAHIAQSKLVLTACKAVREIMANARLLSLSEFTELLPNIKQYIFAVDRKLYNQSLIEYTCSLRDAQAGWWNKWSKLPGFRLAVFGPHSYEFHKGKIVTVCGDRDRFIDNKLVWRQTNLVCYFDAPSFRFDNKNKAPQFNSFMVSTNDHYLEKMHWVRTEKAKCNRLKIRRCDCVHCSLPTKHSAIVARICIPQGAGKGRLVSFFTNQQACGENNSEYEYPFIHLFNAKDRGVNYSGIFAAQLTFTLEFSSLLVGVCRFIQNILCELRKECGENNNHTDWDRYLFHNYHDDTKNMPIIEHLKELFGFLQSKCPPEGWSNRYIVMLSDLDRMVDAQGDAYSPTHRAFFRLITGWNNHHLHSRLPIDFILIAAKPECPIRYLSLEQSYDPAEHRLDEKWKKGRWHIRKDRNCALQLWTELKALDSNKIIREALLYSLLSKDVKYVDTHQNMFADEEQIVTKKNEIEEILSIIQGREAGGSNDEEAESKTKDGERAGDYREDITSVMPDSLRNFLKRRTLHAFILSALVVEYWEMVRNDQRIDSVSETNTAFRVSVKLMFNRLSAAYTRDRFIGYFQEVFKIYSDLDGRKEINTGCVYDEWRKDVTESAVAKERLRALIVDHLALFAHPISSSSLERCPEIRVAARQYQKHFPITSISRLINEVLDQMACRGLVSRNWKYNKLCIKRQLDGGKVTPEVKWVKDSVEDSVFALDPEIISVVRAKSGLSIYDSFTNIPFQSSLYTSQTENSVKPEMQHFEKIGEIVRSLLKAPHRDMVGFNDAPQEWNNLSTTEQQNRLNLWADSFRSAYVLIRGTFSVSVLSRLDNSLDYRASSPPFDEYRTWIRKCLNSASLYTTLLQLRKKDDDSNPLAVNEPFFREEVSWLYNERALVSFVQGRLFDALPLYDIALNISGRSARAAYAIASRSQYRRIRLNQALAQLERGHLNRAKGIFESILRETAPRWRTDTPSTVHTYAKGYLALCFHLTDDYSTAKTLYMEVIDHLKGQGFIRGQSIFRRHYADLLRAMSKSREDDNFTEATNQLRTSEELATGVRAVDLQNYTLIAKARLQRDRAQREGALNSLRQAERYARRMGIHKMLAEVYKVRGEVLLADGEATQAGYVTSQAIAIAKRNGMRLRKISAVIIQARILRVRGQHQDAERLLREALQESLALGYATKASAISQLLSKV